MQPSTVFLNNKTQAVRLPLDVRLDSSVKKVFIRINNKDRIISPIDGAWDSFFLSNECASEDFLPERAEQLECERESFDE
ncbi:VapB protein (antitoxin to VapC) [uncultured Candidatus Thioglobus sp.]|nr:VapB protein (antitoxin to VapC) [uncultured Candidatus Thioglobus sp.]SMN00101.1 VapB protein (antitoxin to VapC) [uncultured Candidatus Thioglobus sp.]